MNESTQRVLESIQSVNLDDFKNLISSRQDIDWGDSDFWQLLLNKTKWNNNHVRFMKCIDKVYPEDIEIKSLVMKYYDESNHFLKESISLKSRFKKTFEFILISSLLKDCIVNGFDENRFNLSTKFAPELLHARIVYLTGIIAQEILNPLKHKAFFNYLMKKDDEKLIVNLYDAIGSRENIQTFKIIFPGVYNKVIKDNDAIIKAFNMTQLEKFQFLLELGHKNPVSKDLYSSLFCKTMPNSLAFQEYIVKNMEDISWSNQIVLKSVLHVNKDNSSKRIGLLDIILDRYSLEQFEDCIDLLKEAIKKRDKNNDYVKIIEKHIRYHSLNDKISNNEDKIFKKKKL